MTPEVAKIVAAEQPTNELRALFTKCKDLVKLSRDAMSQHYDVWDRADCVYRGERYVDEQDRKAKARGEPAKVIVPMSYAQVQTFVSFCMTLLMQRDYLFELEGSGVEDARSAKLAQATLQRDVEYNKMKGVLLPQWLTDVGRFGLGVFKTDWVREFVPVKQMVPDPEYQAPVGMPAPTEVPQIEQWVTKPKYIGNRVTVINPYRWFPDTRLPLTKYRQGEFCADETEFSRADLLRMEANGEVAGVKHVPKIPPGDGFDIQNRRSPIISKEYLLAQPDNDARYILVTEVQIRLNPAKTKIAENVVLDETLDQEVVYIIWIANDNRIIRISDSGYEHNEFLYDMAQFFNDQTRLLNFGISEFLGPSQDIMDWLMNSRITNVRKVIQNQLVVDPRFIEMQDLKDRNPVLRLKSTAAVGLALNTYIQQLQVSDVTTTHLTDMQVVSAFSKEATGINENLLGQYSSGRRSARQTAEVSSAAAQRLVTVVIGLWESGLLPCGQKMLSNLRQGLDDEQLVRIIGLQKYIEQSQPDQTGQSPIRNFIPVDKTALVGNYDFMVFDATLPSQRLATAGALQELLVALSKDPRLVLVFGKDPKLVLDEVLELRNVRNAQRFDLTPQRAMELAQLAGLAPNPGNVNPAGTPGGQESRGGGAPAVRAS